MPNNRTDAISLVGLLIAYGWYVGDVIPDGLDQPGLLGRTIGFFVAVTLLMAVVQVLAEWIFGRGQPADREAERDIGRRAGRNAYIAILSVLWAAPFLLAIPVVGVNLTIVACVAAMGLAEIVRYASCLAYRSLGVGRNHRAVMAEQAEAAP